MRLTTFVSYTGTDMLDQHDWIVVVNIMSVLELHFMQFSVGRCPRSRFCLGDFSGFDLGRIGGSWGTIKSGSWDNVVVHLECE